MKKETKLITEIQGNTANPRQIKEVKFKKLVNSLLVFPEMLKLRPIVCNAQMVVLGGNMRTKALSFISEMTETEIMQRLEKLNDYTTKTNEQKVKIIDFWNKFLDKPEIDVLIADNLTDAQQQEFIIKDNASFGEWDFDALANEWDSTLLDDWGVDVWQVDEESNNPKSDDKDLSDMISVQYKIEISCKDEAEQEELYNRMIEEGRECRLLTL